MVLRRAACRGRCRRGPACGSEPAVHPRSKTWSTVAAGQPASSRSVADLGLGELPRHRDGDPGRRGQLVGSARGLTPPYIQRRSRRRGRRGTPCRRSGDRPLAEAANDVIAADQRHADHQRRGGGGGPPRVAHRVLAGQLPADPEQPRQHGRAARTTGRASTGPSIATPRSAPSAPSSDQRHLAAEDAEQHRAAAAAPVSTRPMTARDVERPTGSTATSRIAATGATRAARRAGSSADTTVTTTPTTKAITSERRSTTSGPSGMVEAEAPPSAPAMPLGHADAGDQAERRRDDTDDQRLDQRRPRAPAGGWRRSPAAAPSRGSAGRPGSRTCC